MSLARVLAFAAGQGGSMVPPSLLPDGFACAPVEDRAVRLARAIEFARGEDRVSLGALEDVKSFERRSPAGKTEVVRSFERAGRPGAPGGWPHPDAVAGHRIMGVYTHPASQTALYDLGHGLHAEAQPPKAGAGAFRPGAVMKSAGGLVPGELAKKGWTRAAPPKPPTPARGAKTAGKTAARTAAKPAAKAGQGAAKAASKINPASAVARPGVKAGAAAKVTARPGALARVAGKKPGSPGAVRGAARPRVAARVQAGLAAQQADYMARQGYKVNPKDWQQDWVPPHEARIWPDLHPSGDTKDLSKPGRDASVAKGTADDPIDTKGNVQEALRHLAAGRHVRLNRPSELALIMQAVRNHAAETEAAGKNDKPDWDFGRLTVKGTSLFAGQHKGIRRIHMPQFSGLAQPGTHAAQVAGGAGKFADLTDEFEQHLKDQGVKVERTTMPASHLKATQSELVGAKVAGFAHAFLSGNPKAVKAMSEPIMVTKDGYVVDGHHRWGANMLVDAVDGKLGNDTPMNVRKVDMEIGAMIPHANEWAQRVGIASAAASAGDTGAALKSPARAGSPGKA